MSQRVGGTIAFAIDGVLQQAKGEFSYNLGRGLKSPVLGADRLHGFKEEPQVAFIEGEVTDKSDLDLNALVTATGVTVTLTLANGKSIVLADAYYAGEGTGNTGEGNIGVRFETGGENAEEA